jgi:histidine triad (HIT) family protein
MANCTFCDILTGRLPASPVYQDEICSVFMDIRPVNPGHVLVIPKLHAASLAELDENTGGHLFAVGQRVAAALRRSGIRCEGINFFLADGESAGQEIFHVHLHIFPRYDGDGFGLQFGPHYDKRPSRAELDAVAEKIRLSFV